MTKKINLPDFTSIRTAVTDGSNDIALIFADGNIIVYNENGHMILQTIITDNATITSSFGTSDEFFIAQSITNGSDKTYAEIIRYDW